MLTDQQRAREPDGARLIRDMARAWNVALDARERGSRRWPAPTLRHAADEWHMQHMASPNAGPTPPRVSQASPNARPRTPVFDQPHIGRPRASRPAAHAPPLDAATRTTFSTMAAAASASAPASAIAIPPPFSPVASTLDTFGRDGGAAQREDVPATPLADRVDCGQPPGHANYHWEPGPPGLPGSPGSPNTPNLGGSFTGLHGGGLAGSMGGMPGSMVGLTHAHMGLSGCGSRAGSLAGSLAGSRAGSVADGWHTVSVGAESRLLPIAEGASFDEIHRTACDKFGVPYSWLLQCRECGDDEGEVKPSPGVYFWAEQALVCLSIRAIVDASR